MLSTHNSLLSTQSCLGAGAPTANRAGETSALGDGMIETARTEHVVTSRADHEMAIENQVFAAAASLLGGEQVVFHFPDHTKAPFLGFPTVHINILHICIAVKGNLLHVDRFFIGILSNYATIRKPPGPRGPGCS